MTDLVVEWTIDADRAELAADRMWQSGATAVELRDGEGDTTVVASFPTDPAARQVAVEMAAEGVRLVAVDPGWRDVWRSHAEPVEVGRHLLIAPAWRDVPVGGGRLVLRIDPGDCFGSGTHPSTRLILAALDRERPHAGHAVLDVGCGSGILAVAAARLGAGQVTAMDIDPAALIATRGNAAVNGVADRLVAVATSLEHIAGPFDLALVNVTAAVHAELGPLVITRMRPGGRVLVAGLLPGQWRHVASSYGAAKVTQALALDGWEGMELAL